MSQRQSQHSRDSRDGREAPKEGNAARQPQVLACLRRAEQAWRLALSLSQPCPASCLMLRAQDHVLGRLACAFPRSDTQEWGQRWSQPEGILWAALALSAHMHPGGWKQVWPESRGSDAVRGSRDCFLTRSLSPVERGASVTPQPAPQDSLPLQLEEALEVGSVQGPRGNAELSVDGVSSCAGGQC